MKLRGLGLATCLSLCACGAWSQAYVAAGAGPSRFDGPCSFVQCDDGGTAARLQLGYRLDGPWAIEAAYTRHGKRKGPPGSGSHTDARLSGLSVGGAWFADLSPQWDVTLRAGLAHNRLRYQPFVVADIGGGFSVREIGDPDTETHNTLYVGAGAAYRLTPTLSLGADLDVTRHALFDSRITVVTLLATLRASF